jgi:hypothetical protein
MPYPLTLNGKVPSEVSDIQAALTKIEDGLREGKARGVRREGDAIHFQGSLMARRFGGSVLTVISWGTIRVVRSGDQVEAEYSLHFIRNHAIRAAVTGAAFGAIYFGVKTLDPVTVATAGVLFWILLASMDYLMAASIFPRYLASKLQES